MPKSSNQAQSLNHEKRVLNRISIAPNSGFSVTIEIGSQKYQANLIDLSPVGVCVSRPEEIAVGQLKESRFVLTVFYGRRVVAELQSPQVVRWNQSANTIVFSTISKIKLNSREKYRSAAISSMSPTVMGPSPLGDKEVLYFKVENFNGGGFLLSTSLRNKFLLPGSRIESAQVIIPGLKIFEATLLIRHVFVKSQKLNLGVALDSRNIELLEALAQYYMFGENHGEQIQLSQLQSLGLPSKKLSKGFRIGPVESIQDYTDILKVRLSAYRSAGKFAGERPEDMADEYDERSIILCARASGKIVGTVRLVCSDGVSDFPFEKLVEFPWSNGLERKSVYEVSRLAVLPEFQGTDLVLALFKAVAREGTVSNHAALCLATKELRHLYIRLGAKKISQEVPHPVLKDETMALFHLEIDRFLKGKGMPVLAWDLVVKDVFDSLVFLGLRKKEKFSPTKFFKRNIEKFFLSLKKKKKK